MKNAEIFIDYYNKIDAFLQKEINSEQHISFVHKIKTSKNPVIVRYRDELNTFADLRNAIVHNPRIDGETIAEPHPEVVSKMQSIYDKLSNPERVFPKFQSNLISVKSDDLFKKLIFQIQKHPHAQFPIVNEHGFVIELINSYTISRWFAKEVADDDEISISKTRISDLLDSIKYKQNYQFLPKSASVYDAREKFIKHLTKVGRNLDALFITENGEQYEKPLGLITVGDLTEIN